MTLKTKTLELRSELLEDARIPKKYWTEDISGYIGAGAALVRAHRYTSNWKKALGFCVGLCFYGPANSQKSLLLTHVLKCVLSKGYGGLYVTANEVVDIAIEKKETRLSFHALGEPDLLVIDNMELLHSSKSTFPLEAILRAIRLRLDNGRPFLVGTRHQPDSFEEVFGESITSSLQEATIMVRCQGDDLKRQQKMFNVKHEILGED